MGDTVTLWQRTAWGGPEAVAGLEAGVVACSHLPNAWVCICGTHVISEGPLLVLCGPLVRKRGQVFLEDHGSGARHSVIVFAFAEF